MANPWENDAPVSAAQPAPWERDKPAKARTKPRREIGLGDVVSASPLASGVGAAETALALGSGAVSGLVGGVRFLGALAQNQYNDPGLDSSGRVKGVDQARQQFDSAVEGGTYQPRTEQGRLATQGILRPLQAWGEGAAISGENVARRTGSPAAGAAANALLNMGPVVGVRRPAATAAGNVARTYSNAWQATSPEARLVQPRPLRRGQPDAPDVLPAPPGVDQSVLTPPQASLPPPARQGAFPPVPPELAADAPTGPAIPTSVRIARGAQEVARAVAEPMTRQGPEDAAVRLLARFGFRPEDFEGLTSQPTRTGARTTLPEQVASPEGATAAARVMDTVRLDPEQFTAINARDAANNAARVRALEQLAGRGGARAEAEALRAELTSPVYRRALKTTIDPSALTASQLAYMDALFDRPAIKQALEDGAENLRNEGIENEARYSMPALHAAKVSLDQRITNAPRNASERLSVQSMNKARDALVRVIEELSPEYGTARREYARLSRPVNQYAVGETLLERGTLATGDLGAGASTVPILSQAKLRNLTAPQNQARTIKQSIGREGPQRLEDLMTPQQMELMNAVLREVDRKAAVERAANGPGSGTAQRLLAQNILNAMGLADDAPPVVTTAVERVTRLADMVTQSDAKLRAAVADLILNPGKARAAFERATPKRQAQRRANNPPKP